MARTLTFTACSSTTYVADALTFIARAASACSTWMPLTKAVNVRMSARVIPALGNMVLMLFLFRAP